MILIDRVKAMIGWLNTPEERPQPDPINAGYKAALQRNEKASCEARKALEEAFADKPMTEAIRRISGKM